MKNFKVLWIASLLCVILFNSCKKNDPVNNPPDPSTSGNQFGIKTATVTYDFIGTTTLYFDNNGSKLCIDYDITSERYITDGTNAYILDTSAKTYTVAKVADIQSEASMYFFKESAFAAAGSGFTKSTQTIAGKSCSIYTGMVLGVNTSIGGWSGILFLESMDGSDLIRATAFSETIPANIFSIPSGYTKQTN